LSNSLLVTKRVVELNTVEIADKLNGLRDMAAVIAVGIV
jgi:hypothetical protein